MTTQPVSFEFKGMEITDPYVSECGRFNIDPKYYGFYEIDTGGGCRALRKDLPEQQYILITTNDGCNIPQHSAGEVEIILGLYSDKDDSDNILGQSKLTVIIPEVSHG